MRVLYVMGQLGGGGAERQLVNLLRAASGSVEAYGYLLNPGGRWQEAVRPLCQELRVCSARSRVARGLELLKLVRQAKPQIIHCWNAYTAVYPLLTRWIHRVPVVVNLRGDLTRDAGGRAGRPPSHARLLMRADWIVSNSESNLAALRQAGLRFARTRVIHNGVELPPETGTPRDASTLVGVGSLNELKNWPLLIRVAARLRGDGREVRLRIYGEGPLRDELSSVCSAAGLDPQEVLPGFATEVERRLAEATLLVHCSRTEGSPNAVLEALAAGLPVVATDLPSVREIDAGHGIVRRFPVEDDTRCAETVGWLLDDPEARERLGREGRELVRNRYGVDAFVGEFQDVYMRAAGKR